MTLAGETDTRNFNGYNQLYQLETKPQTENGPSNNYLNAKAEAADQVIYGTNNIKPSTIAINITAESCTRKSGSMKSTRGQLPPHQPEVCQQCITYSEQIKKFEAST